MGKHSHQAQQIAMTEPSPHGPHEHPREEGTKNSDLQPVDECEDHELRLQVAQYCVSLSTIHFPVPGYHRQLQCGIIQ